MVFLHRPRLLSFKNYLLRKDLPLIAKIVRLGIVAFALFFLPSVVFEGIKEMLSYTQTSPEMMGHVLSSVHFVFVSILLFSSSVHALNSLYLSPENELLLKSPIKPSNLFVAKLMETGWYASWVMFLFYLPVLLAVGKVTPNRLVFALSGLIEIPPLVIIPTCIGMISSLLLVKILPARRVREILIVGSIGVILLIHFTLRGYDLALEELKGSLPQILLDVKSKMPSSNLWLSKTAPTHLALTGSAKNLIEVSLLWYGLLTLSVVAAYRCFVDLYFNTYSSDTVVTSQVLKVSKRRFYHLWLPPTLRAFWIKDTRLFLRDLTQPIQLILFILLVGISVYTLKGVASLKGSLSQPASYWNDLLSISILSFHCITSILYTGRFIYPIMSQEREMSWIIKGSPVTRIQFYLSKFLVALLPSSVILLTFTLVACFITNLESEFIWVPMLGSAINLGFLILYALMLGSILSSSGDGTSFQAVASLGNFLFMLSSLIIVPFNWLLALVASAAVSHLSANSDQNVARLLIIVFAGMFHLAILRLLSQTTREYLQQTENL